MRTAEELVILQMRCAHVHCLAATNMPLCCAVFVSHVYRHVVRISGDAEVTVGEDEPAKHAVEQRISDIEVGPDAGHPIREYFDKWKAYPAIDTRVPMPSLRGMAVSWVGAFLG